MCNHCQKFHTSFTQYKRTYLECPSFTTFTLFNSTLGLRPYEEKYQKILQNIFHCDRQFCFSQLAFETKLLL